MAGRPTDQLATLCRYCGGDKFYHVDGVRGLKQHCLGCGWSPQDRPEHAEPVPYKKPKAKPRKS